MAQTIAKTKTIDKVKVASPKETAAKTPKVKETAVKPVEVKKIEVTLVKFSHPNLKVSPRKLRLLVNSLTKFNPNEVVVKLRFVNSNASRLFLTVLKNAIATAKNNYNLNPETLKFHEVRVDEGSKLKRMDKSHGSRFARGIIVKRHSRLSIVLSGTIAG